MFTREIITKYHALNDSYIEALNLASELLRVAQDRYGERTHKLIRSGREIELTEKVMWDEVFYTGNTECDSGKRLKSLHPDVFAAYEKEKKYAEQLKHYALTELGVDTNKMTLSEYLRVTEELIDLKLRESKN